MPDIGMNGFARFKEQVALVVGGAQGIGKAIAVRLAREGAHVVISDIDCPMMERTTHDLCSERLSARMLHCDVRPQGHPVDDPRRHRVRRPRS